MRLRNIYILIFAFFLVSCTKTSTMPDGGTSVVPEGKGIVLFAPPMVRGEGDCSPESYADGDKYRIITYASFGILKNEKGETIRDKDGYPVIHGDGNVNKESCYRLSRTGYYAYDEKYVKNSGFKESILGAFTHMQDAKTLSSGVLGSITNNKTPAFISQDDLNNSDKCTKNGWISTAMPGLYYIYYVKPYDTPFEFVDGSPIYKDDSENGPSLITPFDNLDIEKLQSTRFIINPSDNDFNFYATCKIEPTVLGGYGILNINKGKDNYLRPYRCKLRFKFFQDTDAVQINGGNIRIYGAGVDKTVATKKGITIESNDSGYEMKVDLGKQIVEEKYPSGVGYREIDISSDLSKYDLKDPKNKGLSYVAEMYVAPGLYGSAEFKSKRLGGTPAKWLKDINLKLAFDIKANNSTQSVELPPARITSNKFHYLKACHTYTFNVRLVGNLITVKLDKIELGGSEVDWEDVSLDDQEIG